MRKFLVNWLVILLFGVLMPTILAAEDINAEEQQLISEVLSAQKIFGDNSKEHAKARRTLIGFYSINFQHKNFKEKLIPLCLENLEYSKARFFDNKTALALNQYLLANAYILNNDYGKAIPIFSELYSKLSLANKYDNLSNAYFSDFDVIYAKALIKNGSYNLALEVLNTYFSFIEDNGDIYDQAKTKHTIKVGIDTWIEINTHVGNLEEAINNFLLDLNRKDKKNIFVATSLPKLYRKLAQIEREKSYYGKAMNMINIAIELTEQSNSYGKSDVIELQFEKLEIALESSLNDKIIKDEIVNTYVYIKSNNVCNQLTISGNCSFYHEYIIKDFEGDVDGALTALKRALSWIESNQQSSAQNDLLGRLYYKIGVVYLEEYRRLINNNAVVPSQDELISGKLQLSIENLEKSVTLLNVTDATGFIFYPMSKLAVAKLAKSPKGNAEVKVLYLKILQLTNGANIDARRAETVAQMNLSWMYMEENKNELAILWGKQAINSLQGLRNDSFKQDKVLNQVLENKSLPFYYLFSRLLFRMGRSGEAQQVLQMLKERELYESLRDANDDPRKMRLRFTNDEQDALDKYNNYLKQTKVDNQSVKNYEQFSKELIKKLSEIDVLVKITPSKALQNNSSVMDETAALQKAINSLSISEPQAKAIGVQYLLTKDKLLIVLNVPNEKPIFKEVPIASIKLYRNIVQVTKQVQDTKADAKYYGQALKELYAVLIEPILPELKRRKAKTLMLSLDSQIRLLPFAALIDSNGNYLLESYTLALYNEAANQTMEKPSNPKWHVAAMGLSNAVGSLKPLNSVSDELKGILNIKGIDGDEYLNDQFTRDQFVHITNQTSGKHYNVLHVASHFELQPSDPGESSLYMGDGTKFTLKDMINFPLKFNSFELVTYSACQTAVTGNNNGSGKAIESLSAQTQRQGAQAVMATLWQVSDQSTAKLMQDYYAKRSQGLNKAEALRAVQLNMALGKAGNANWKSPHHWASFVISGNWR